MQNEARGSVGGARAIRALGNWRRRLHDARGSGRAGLAVTDRAAGLQPETVTLARLPRPRGESTPAASDRRESPASNAFARSGVQCFRLGLLLNVTVVLETVLVDSVMTSFTLSECLRDSNRFPAALSETVTILV